MQIFEIKFHKRGIQIFKLKERIVADINVRRVLIAIMNPVHLPLLKLNLQYNTLTTIIKLTPDKSATLLNNDKHRDYNKYYNEKAEITLITEIYSKPPKYLTKDRDGRPSQQDLTNLHTSREILQSNLFI